MSIDFQKSLENTEKLKQLILDNQELPLMIFCSKDAHRGENQYEHAFAGEPSIKELTLHGDYWLEKDDLESKLYSELCNKYADMEDTDYQNMIAEKASNTEFVKSIVIYVG